MKYFIGIFSLIILISAVYVWDATQRADYFSRCTNNEIFQKFYTVVPDEKKKLVYEQYFNNPDYDFFQKPIITVKVAKNKKFGWLFNHRLDKKRTHNLVSFFTNPDNFTWQYPDWNHFQHQYILKFYDQNNKEIAVMYIDTLHYICRTFPFTPNIKYGVVDEKSLKKLLKELK